MTYIDFLVLIIQQWFVIISLVMKSCLKHTGLRSVNIVIPNDGTLEEWKVSGFPKALITLNFFFFSFLWQFWYLFQISKFSRTQNL